MGSHIVYDCIDINVHVNTIVNNMWSSSVCTLSVYRDCFHIWPDDGSFEPKYMLLCYWLE